MRWKDVVRGTSDIITLVEDLPPLPLLAYETPGAYRRSTCARKAEKVASVYLVPSRAALVGA